MGQSTSQPACEDREAGTEYEMVKAGAGGLTLVDFRWGSLLQAAVLWR